MADEGSSVTAAPARRLADRYRLFERLAVGGMAEVWHARDETLKRDVAVKLLKPVLQANPTAVERFRREALAGARLSHPNLVGVYDTISEPGLEAIVMELVDGPSLRQRLDGEHRLEPSEVIAIAQQILSGLTLAHRNGVIHRDIKPANILMANDGRILLGDFGIAKAVSPDASAGLFAGSRFVDEAVSDAPVVDLTSDDIMLGTAKYIAPEQVTGAPVDARTDLYSLAVVLYECLAGEPPFDAGSDAATALARLHQPPRPVAWVRRDIPVGLAELIDHSLRKEMSGRPSSAAEAMSILATGGPVPVADRTRDIPRDPTIVGRGNERPASNGPPPKPGTRPVDVTPRVPGTPPDGAPKDSAPRSVHIVVGVMLAIALVVAAVVAGSSQIGLDWFRSGSGAKQSGTAVNVAAEPIDVVALRTFDPSPGDGRERDELLPALTDGDKATAWMTERYKGRNLAGKSGVGIIVQLERDASTYLVTIDSPGRDWAASAYRSSEVHTDLAQWGERRAEGRSASGPLELEVGGAGQYVLIWITDPGVTEPSFRLAITEIAVRG
ncbi:MAG: serine/threonine-protein kinase [Acidimicrobiia bacterium]